jgi:3-hydroxyisobutyrate dehydrogenase-like beta-hydroxyacid dehydrogenase
VTERLVIALLGLGEAGGAIAADLVAAGAIVHGWDPDAARDVEGIDRSATAAEAAAGAEVVLSVNAQSAAVAAADTVAGVLTPGHLYADLNTAAAAVKRDVAAVVAPSGAAFADVALLAPVPGRGIRTPCLASGPGAKRFAALFGRLGMPVDVLGPEPGEAATRKLLRSVFTKGLAAATVESLAAAEAAGCGPWLRAEIEAALDSADRDLAERLVEGSKRHARRRADEMAAAADLVAELGVEPHIAAASRDLLRALGQPGADGVARG